MTSTGEVFARAASVLPVGGRLYVQTLVFGRNMVPSTRSRSERRESPMHGLWRDVAPAPRSFLPFGALQVIRVAEPYLGY